MKRALHSLLVVGSALLPPSANAASLAFQQAVTDDTPILYYQFNEPSGNAVNHGSLGNTHDATYNGTIERGKGTPVGDDAVTFSSVEDYLESLGVAPAGVLGNPSFTAEAIVFVPVGGSAASWAPFLHWGPSPGSNDGKSVFFSFSNNAPTEVFVGFYNAGLQSPTGSLALGRWHHVLWVRQGGGTANTGSTLYIDGVNLTASLTNDLDLPANGLTPAVEASEFRVNRARNGTRFFVGSIDELALYDRALTAQEVAEHVAASGIGTSMDVDGDGVEAALTDGLLVLRYLFGFRGATLISGAVSGTCTRCTAVAIEAYIASI